jgi:hypothetical protein
VSIAEPNAIQGDSRLFKLIQGNSSQKNCAAIEQTCGVAPHGAFFAKPVATPTFGFGFQSPVSSVALKIRENANEIAEIQANKG